MGGGATGDNVEDLLGEGQDGGVAGDEAHVGGAAATGVPARGREHRLRGGAGHDPARDATEPARRVAAAGCSVPHALGAPGGAPGGKTIEVLARRVQRARHVGSGAAAELLLHTAWVRVAHLAGRSARWRRRKSWSSGDRSNRRDASSTSLSRLRSGLSWSWSSIHFTACLMGASPAIGLPRVRSLRPDRPAPLYRARSGLVGPVQNWPGSIRPIGPCP